VAAGGLETYRDGTTHVIFEPEDFIARLAALVPKRRAHLTRYHGGFAPASRDRAGIVPKTCAARSERGEAVATGRQRAMSWAQRLRRVFATDIETLDVKIDLNFELDFTLVGCPIINGVVDQFAQTGLQNVVAKYREKEALFRGAID
jgi:hypothetical protein